MVKRRSEIRDIMAKVPLSNRPSFIRKSPPVSIDSLFASTRLKRPISFQHFLLWAYLPLGFLFMLYRFLVCFSFEVFLFRLGNLLHINNFMYRLYCIGAGVRTKVIGGELDKTARIIVSNHTLELDILPLRSLIGPLHAISPIYYKHLIFTRNMVKEIQPIYMDTTDQSTLRENILKVMASSSDPIFCFPEGALTDGRHLLGYHKFLFSLGYPVQPIAIKCSYPFSVINCDTLFAPTWHNILWFFAMPFVTWEITFLPKTSIKEAETPEEFAKRVQMLTADVINATPTEFFKKQKKELAKELFPYSRRTVRYKRAFGSILDRSWKFTKKKNYAFLSKVRLISRKFTNTRVATRTKLFGTKISSSLKTIMRKLDSMVRVSQRKKILNTQSNPFSSISYTRVSGTPIVKKTNSEKTEAKGTPRVKKEKCE